MNTDTRFYPRRPSTPSLAAVVIGAVAVYLLLIAWVAFVGMITLGAFGVAVGYGKCLLGAWALSVVAGVFRGARP